MGTLIKTEKVDHLYSRIVLNTPNYIEVRKFLSEDLYIWKSYWEKKEKRKIERKYKYPLIRQDGSFLTGYHEIMTKMSNGKYAFYPNRFQIFPYDSLFLNEQIRNSKIKLKEFQKNIIKKLFSNQVNGRGVIVAPTGSGKTVIALAISSLNNDTIFLVHTKDLMYQTYERYCECFGKDKVGLIGGGKLDIKKEYQYYICLYKTLWNILKFGDWSSPELASVKLSTFFNVLIVDEVHHLSKFKSRYAEVVKAIHSPIRVGLTATPFKYEGHNSDEGFFVNEGLLGPQIDIVESQYLIEEGIMSKPNIKLVNTEKNKSLNGLTKYSDIYEEGIVKNRFRNLQIIQLAKKYVKEKKSVLILVDKIKHGEILSLMLKRNKNIDHIFIQGDSKEEIRTNAKDKLDKKKIDIVIATTIFKEGVDIPNLDVYINAAGGKGETPVIQKIGRVLRATDKKKEAIIIDFLDNGKYLAEHSLQRIKYYNERGWL